MASYFFIQSLDSLSNSKTDEQFRLMQELADRSNRVQVLLVQNAVFMARKDAQATGLDALLGSGINVFVDDFSLLQRGIARTELRTGLQTAEINCVVDAMLDQQKVIWN